LAARVPIKIRSRDDSSEDRPTPAAVGTSDPEGGEGDSGRIIVVPGGYRATPAGLVWDRPTRDGPVELRLTNFVATIATDVVEDDGAELRRRFEIEAHLFRSCRRFSVPAEAFPSMGWAAEHLGARAIVYPGLGLRDHARTAVQVLSGEVPEHHVHCHTGWREREQGWAYLHAGGAIGARGPIPRG